MPPQPPTRLHSSTRAANPPNTTQMNKEHRHDLAAILQHQLGITTATSPEGEDPELTDISLSTLTITSAGGRAHTVPISPPMASWADRRARLVDMTLAARSALGLDDAGAAVAVRTFVPPSGAGAVVCAGVVFYFACFADVQLGMGSLVRPGGAAGPVLDAWFPGGVGAFVAVVRAIFWPVMAIHLGECWWLDRTRLGRYGVPRGGGLWWKWIVRCFFEGFTTFKSFDAVVEGERKAE